MKITYLFIVAVLSISFCSLPAYSQTVRQTNLYIDDGTGHFLNLVLGGLVSGGQTITFPNTTGIAALTTDITGGTLAGSFTTLTVSPSVTDIGLTISNGGTGDDVSGNDWQVDYLGNSSFNTLALSGNPLTVNNGGTGTRSLSAYGLLSMNNDGSTVISQVLSDAQIAIGTGGALNYETLGGDVAMTDAGNVSVNSYFDGVTDGNAFGDMASQSPSAVAITGGSIDNTAINFASLSVAKITSSVPAGDSPTLTTNAAGISGLTLSANATDAAGMITFTTDGTVASDNVNYVELDFHYASTDPIVVISPANDPAASDITGIYVVATGGTPGNFRIWFGSTWLDFGSAGPPITYSYYYHVIDTAP